jgi:hypothetical protein
VAIEGRDAIHAAVEPDWTLCGRPHVRKGYSYSNPSGEVTLTGDAKPRPKLIDVEADAPTCLDCQKALAKQVQQGPIFDAFGQAEPEFPIVKGGQVHDLDASFVAIGDFVFTPHDLFSLANVLKRVAGPWEKREKGIVRVRAIPDPALGIHNAELAVIVWFNKGGLPEEDWHAQVYDRENSGFRSFRSMREAREWADNRLRERKWFLAD